jgi:hypothetical protein
MITELLAFAFVFILALVFFFLAVIVKTKLSLLYAVLSSVFWFALGGIHLIVFATTPSLLILSFLWYAVGIVALIIGLVLSITSMADNKKGKELEVT